MASPCLETLPSKLEPSALDRLFRALLAGDLVYAALPGEREVVKERLLKRGIPSYEILMKEAKQIGSAESPQDSRRLAAVGTPMSLTVLDSGILEGLEQDGETILRQPLSEYFWFLWKDCGDNPTWESERYAILMTQIGSSLGARSAFSAEPDKLQGIADRSLRYFAGSNGRYRFAKTVDASRTQEAVLLMSPRYENTDTILDMRGLSEACAAPLFRIQLDQDWDEASQSRLNSFLYYV